MPSVRFRLRRPSAAMVVALVALFVALGGPARAAKLIDGDEIRKGSVTTKQIKNGSLKVEDLSRRAARSLGAIPDNSIGAAKYGENSVSTRALAPGSVTTGTLADGGVTAADLAANSVGAEEVGDDAIGQPEIRPNGVGASELADNTVGSGKVIDGGLSIRDVARQWGTMEWPVETLAGGACQVATVPVRDIAIAGDHVLISPVTPWPPSLIYAVNGTNAETEFKVQACNRGRDPVAGARYTFNYAILGN